MSNLLVELSSAMADAAEVGGTSTVLIDARRRFPASGIAISSDLILTANHVVEREQSIMVHTGSGTEVGASLAGRDPGSDLAVLRLESAAAVPASPAETVKVGQLVLAIGRPGREGIEVSLGVVSAIGGAVRTPHGSLEKYIRTDAIFYPGFSGGPLVDASGKVVGVNTSGFGPGAVLTIPAESAWKIARQLADHGTIKRGYLGVRSQPVELSAATQTALQRKQATGLLVLSVEPESPADLGGLIVGDIIVGFAGTSVSDHEELFVRLTGEVVGQSTMVEILRGGQPTSLPLKIGIRQ